MRIKSTASRKHRRFLKRAKGFKQARRTRIQTVKEALLHAGQYAYVGRRLKKRNLRALWIIRLNAAVKKEGLTYSGFIQKIKSAKIEIDRKILSQIASTDIDSFKKILDLVKNK